MLSEQSDMGKFVVKTTNSQNFKGGISMRNLKRALSMALASVMLLGMMVVGTSAASINDFTDADAIDNKEAVAIATGLGIFDGYTDGSFGPDKTVTRAEMAVVIAKILHGADVDPSNFAGVAKFNDVPAWAEGYVNLAASLNIIKGIGEGKFNPNATVTTVEASTMLLKALGYFVDDETALGADWQLEVTSKATSLGLYGDLALGMNAGLTRENVAELVYNALFAQRVAFDDYRGLYVKANDRNVVVTNGTDDANNTLAQDTFGLYIVEGQVIAIYDLNRKALLSWASGNHSGTYVPLYAIGKGAEKFDGVIDNTDIMKIIRKLKGVK